MARRLLAAWIMVATAAPAQAATIPPAELRPDTTSAELGFFHAAVDRALSDHLAVGGMGWFFPNAVQSIAGRASYRLVNTPEVSISGLLGAGFTNENTDPFGLGTHPHWRPRAWLQPALNASVALFPILRLRATVGPIVNVISVPPTEASTLGLIDPAWWPDVELALRILPGLELSASYPDTVSLRYTW